MNIIEDIHLKILEYCDTLDIHIYSQCSKYSLEVIQRYCKMNDIYKRISGYKSVWKNNKPYGYHIIHYYSHYWDNRTGRCGSTSIHHPNDDYQMGELEFNILIIAA